MAPLEPWQKVMVDGENFPNSAHGSIACITCHGGVQSPDKEAAHTGLTRDPSADPQARCGQCHTDVAAHMGNSLHATLQGFWTTMETRSMPSTHDQVELAVNNHCSRCHTTCGDCHISQPNSVGGGFVSGHMFNRTPSMTQNCTACHGSRVGNEFLGKHEGLKADVHFREGRMGCVDCHSGAEMHGQPAECNSCHTGPTASEVPPADHRYEGIQTPRCESCHAVVSTGQDDIVMHQMHGGNLSCQVCHSVSYTSCDGCHVALSETTGTPFFETKASYFTFLIGRNPIQSYERPYQYVPVRHVPIEPDSFAFYGQDVLPRFDVLETWKYATPHNIQRRTPQTESCNACHGNKALFLTTDKVAPAELLANQAVIIEEIPEPITSAEQIP